MNEDNVFKSIVDGRLTSERIILKHSIRRNARFKREWFVP